jgi:hypothetical protein
MSGNERNYFEVSGKAMGEAAAAHRASIAA